MKEFSSSMSADEETEQSKFEMGTPFFFEKIEMGTFQVLYLDFGEVKN